MVCSLCGPTFQEALASIRYGVAKPSVKLVHTAASASRASPPRPCRWQSLVIEILSHYKIHEQRERARPQMVQASHSRPVLDVPGCPRTPAS